MIEKCHLMKKCRSKSRQHKRKHDSIVSHLLRILKLRRRKFVQDYFKNIMDKIFERMDWTQVLPLS